MVLSICQWIQCAGNLKVPILFEEDILQKGYDQVRNTHQRSAITVVQNQVAQKCRWNLGDFVMLSMGLLSFPFSHKYSHQFLRDVARFCFSQKIKFNYSKSDFN